jgi:hypothetical protein
MSTQTTRKGRAPRQDPNALGLLVSALAGEKDARLALSDLLKENGHEQAAETATRLFSIGNVVHEKLRKSMHIHAHLGEWDEAKLTCGGKMEAYEDILNLLKEWVEGRCQKCGDDFMEDSYWGKKSSTDPNLCHHCASSGDDVA